MVEKIRAIGAMLVAGLLFIESASAATMNCILLPTPITKPNYATHACLSNVNWSLINKQFVTRLSYGYVDGMVWRETGDLHLRTENKAAIADNPLTLQNEAVPADPAYDNAMAVVVSTNMQFKALEIVILEIIQAAGGPMGKIVSITVQ